MQLFYTHPVKLANLLHVLFRTVRGGVNNKNLLWCSVLRIIVLSGKDLFNDSVAVRAFMSI